MPKKTKKTTRSAARSLYSVHPSVAYGQAIIQNLPEKTGRSVEEWIRLVKRSAPPDEKGRRDWLRKEHGLGGTTAWLIAERSVGKGAAGTEADAYLKAAAGYVEAMYATSKAALRPIHDALIELARSLGGDVKVCPSKTIVPLYRNHVFAEIKPTSRTRIDLGLALKGTKKKPIRRLIPTGGLEKGDRITHRFAITRVDEIDGQVEAWLRLAYEHDGDR